MNKKAYTVFNKPYDTLKKNYNNKIVTMQKFINRLNSDIPRARYPMDDTVVSLTDNDVIVFLSIII